MKFLHLADLHLGKKVNDISMLNEQKLVLAQALDIVKEGIDVVLIAGDIFDRAIPNSFALELFSCFLEELNKLNVIVAAISGNHDNPDRVAYLAPLLQKNNIFISNNFNGSVEYIDLKENIRVYLLPYLYPAIIRNYYPESEISNYNDAIKLVIDSIELDKNKTNIILAHQFVAGINPPELSSSEQKCVGGVDIISADIFKDFDYVALGHLHCPQRVGYDNIRYGGSILKYSFSEINQKKVFTIFEFDKKELKLSFKDIHFERDLKEYRGYLKDFLEADIKKDDYIHFILLDEDCLDAKKKLSSIYPNIMLLEFDNSYTRSENTILQENLKDKTIYEHFLDFYKSKMDVELSSDREKIVKEIIGGLDASL